MNDVPLIWDDRINMHDNQVEDADGRHFIKPELGVAPGASKWQRRPDGSINALWFVCPCGCRNVSSLFVASVGGERVWQFDGNETAPTLQPSIQKLTACRWHGHLTAGAFKSC